MIVEVNQEDIDNGLTSACNCPVALAVKRTFNKPFALVTNTKAYIGDDSETRTLVGTLPYSAISFIEAFDLGWKAGPVKPFNFELSM